VKSKWLTATGLGLGVVLLLAVNIFSDAAFTSVRLDLTQNRLYTLSDGTLKVLAGLEEPVRLRLFLSRDLANGLPSISSYAKRVQELLREYERAAKGKLLATVFDPEPFSKAEDRAVGYGLRGIPLDEESTFYFGLVASGATKDEQVIPFLSTEREELLEYDITRLIYQVSSAKQRVIGLISFLPIDGITGKTALAGAPQPWMIFNQIQQFFEVRTLAPNVTDIPDDVDVLMLVHPKNLSDVTLYAIDQFVLRGGRALVFVDPYAEIEQAPSPGIMGIAAPQRSSDLGKLGDSWGLELVPAKVVGDLKLATRVQFQREGRLVAIDYPVWINLPPTLLNQDDVVTAQLGGLVLATPGQLLKKAGATTKMTPLFESTPDAAQIDTSRLGMFQDPQDILRNYRPEGKRLVMAVRLSGPANSAFPDGPPPPQDDKTDGAKNKNKGQATDKDKPQDRKREHLAKSNNDINVVVVADTDMLRDQFWVRVQDFLGSRLEIPTAANGTFVVNALDSLSGSNDLISIRSRGRFTRPFTRVNALRQQAELRFRQKEQQLITRLQETEDKLVALERNKQGDDTVVLTEAQQKEIDRFRQEKIRMRKQLREVRRELRKSIETLEGRLKFVNIGMMPVLIGIGGIVVGAYQVRRRRKGTRTTAETR